MKDAISYVRNRGLMRFLDNQLMSLMGDRYAKWRSWQRLKVRIAKRELKVEKRKQYEYEDRIRAEVRAAGLDSFYTAYCDRAWGKGHVAMSPILWLLAMAEEKLIWDKAEAETESQK